MGIREKYKGLIGKFREDAKERIKNIQDKKI